MKRVLLWLCTALSLFSGFAVAAQVVSSLDTGSPLMAAAPPLMERICPVAKEGLMTIVTYNPLIGTGIAVAPSPVAYDTGDPKAGAQA